MAGNKVCLVNQIGRSDRVVSETKVGNRDTAGLLGIIEEIALRVFIRIIADDLDGVFVGANRTV